MARQIIVEIVGEDRKLTGTLNEATAKVEGFGGRLKNVGKGIAIGAGVAGFNLLTSAISVGIGKLDEMHQAFLEDEESQLRLQNSLKNTVKNYDAAIKSAEAFAGAQQRLGFEDDDVRASLGQLVGITHDYAEAQKLSTVAIDLARAKNIDLAEATNIVGRAYTGVARGLTNVGIDARGAASGLELVQRIIQNTKGAAEAYAKTGAGRMAVANAKLQDTMEKVGKAIDKVSEIVIPIMVAGLGAIVDATGEVIQWISDFIGWLNNGLGPALNTIIDLAARAFELLQGIATLDLGKVAHALRGPDSGGSGSGGTINVGGGTGGPTVTNIGVPFHHDGGVVAGPFGSDQLIMAQAGERVIPNGASAPTIVINIASFIGSDRDIDRFSDRLAFRLASVSKG